MDSVSVLFILHALASCFMMGLVWFVQVVHYPLMARVPMNTLHAYEAAHQRRTTFVVAPAMLLEASTAVALLLIEPAGPPRWMLLASVGLVAAVWLSTAALQMPLHQKLSTCGDEASRDMLVDQLVRSNVIRVAVWTARAALSLAMLLEAARGEVAAS
ncbi:MAG: hypothetical protein SFZ23_00210 [Planctomycetota bacterium]|nr:hypothetical protein [Planctomycetota bacterium]